MKRKLNLLLTSIVWVGLLMTISQPAFAQEGVGGAVQTNGEIGFYKEAVPDPPAPSEPIPSTSSSSAGVEEPKIKPKGKLPSTGELVKRSLSISGIALVLIVVFWFLFKRKKEGTKE
ncbi:hypothetical protein A5881_002315 [Enterococcus termitis]|nr:hypothetical protein A5881_001367 [Enterococcus termitis]